MAATRIDKGLHHFDVASGPFKCHICTLMCPRGRSPRGLGKKKSAISVRITS